MDITDLSGGCPNGNGERCDLHFVVENEVVNTKKRVEKLELASAESQKEIMATLHGMSTLMNQSSIEQKFKDETSREVKVKTLDNTEQINALKSSLKSVEDHNKHVADTMDRVERNISDLASEVRDMDKQVISKEGVTDIVNNAIVADKNQGRDRWFDSLPAKISAGVAILSFIAFFTIKIVITLLAL